MCEGESVIADGPVGVSSGFPASSRSEVVEFYVFQVIDFVEGVRGWPVLRSIKRSNAGNLSPCIRLE